MIKYATKKKKKSTKTPTLNPPQKNKKKALVFSVNLPCLPVCFPMRSFFMPLFYSAIQTQESVLRLVLFRLHLFFSFFFAVHRVTARHIIYQMQLYAFRMSEQKQGKRPPSITAAVLKVFTRNTHTKKKEREREATQKRQRPSF